MDNKEINEKIARKLMMNSVYGKAANLIAVDDPICTEPSIVDQYINKKSATYEREKEDGSIVIETDPLYKDMAHFDFRYVKNMSGMFDGLTFFKGNLNGYAACGDNVIDMSYAYRDTGVSLYFYKLV